MPRCRVGNSACTVIRGILVAYLLVGTIATSCAEPDQCNCFVALENRLPSIGTAQYYCCAIGRDPFTARNALLRTPDIPMESAPPRKRSAMPFRSLQLGSETTAGCYCVAIMA